MENELLKVDFEGIQVVQGLVKFNDYQRIKKEAEDLAEQIKTVEVSEENVKQSKKLLAVVNKRLKELEDTRIGIKKSLLEPYQEFEEQVKEIVGIVKEADAEVREQVKLLEEFDRIEKEEVIKDLFFKRKEKYSLGALLNLNHFLKPSHLNKSMSIEKVEKEMVAFLEQTEKDIQAIQSMPNAGAILHEYVKIGGFNLAEAIAVVTEQVNKEKEIEKKAKALEKASAKEEEKQVFTFKVFDEKDFKLIEMFIQQNKISYEVL
jgi:Protein of unknown function (DUF1351)